MVIARRPESRAAFTAALDRPASQAGRRRPAAVPDPRRPARARHRCMAARGCL